MRLRDCYLLVSYHTWHVGFSVLVSACPDFLFSQPLDLASSSNALNVVLLNQQLGIPIRRTYDDLEMVSRLAVIIGTATSALMSATPSSALQRSAAGLLQHSSAANSATASAERQLFPFYSAFSQDLLSILRHDRVYSESVIEVSLSQQNEGRLLRRCVS